MGMRLAPASDLLFCSRWLDNGLDVFTSRSVGDFCESNALLFADRPYDAIYSDPLALHSDSPIWGSLKKLRASQCRDMARANVCSATSGDTCAE